jgi:hypothetical protein
MRHFDGSDDAALAKLSACTCPKVLTHHNAEITIIETVHRHGCAQLADVKAGPGMSLRHAAGIVDDARARAELRADDGAALRLGALRDRVLEEALYAENIDSGMAVLRRRPHPPGAVIGWLLRYCATTRANRVALGVRVPELGGDASVVEANGLAA